MASDIVDVDNDSNIIIVIESDDEDVEVINEYVQRDYEGATFDLNLRALEVDFHQSIILPQQNLNVKVEDEQPRFDLNMRSSAVLEKGDIDVNANTTNTTSALCHHPQRLSNMERLTILLWLLDKKVFGVLKHGAINAAAAHIGLHRKTALAFWNKANKQRASMQPYNVDNRYHKCGKKRIELPATQFLQLPMGQRTCIRDLAAMLALGATTIWRFLKRGFIKPHTNLLHPSMKEHNMITRMKRVLDLLIGDSAHTKSKYYPMYDYVHLDEKWFYLTQKTLRVCIEANEKPPYRAADSNTNIPKVMFTAVVARPRFNTSGECIFSGKIGIFPFTYEEPAKRSSKNRQRGAMVIKTVKSVNQDVTRAMLNHQIILAIKEEWPVQEENKLYT